MKIIIEKANEKHNNFYSYDKVDYQNSATQVIITCPEHGDFHTTPKNHRNGIGCPHCCEIK